MKNEVRLIERMKCFWEKHFKPHCPDCGGVMDDEMLDMILDKLHYAGADVLYILTGKQTETG